MSFVSFCVVVAAFTFEVSGQEMGGDGFQTRKRKSWIPGQVPAEKVLADAIARLTGERSGIASSVPKPIFGRGGDANDATPTFCRVAREVQTGNFGENQEVVICFVIFEWWRRKEAPSPGCGDKRVASTG